MNMKAYSIILYVCLAFMLKPSDAAPAESEDVASLLGLLKSNKNLLNILSDPNSLSNVDSGAIQSFLSDPNAVSLIGNMLSNPDALANIGNSLKNPSNAQAIADALTDPNSIAGMIKDPNARINSGLGAVNKQIIETSQTDLIISGLTNLLESLKSQGATDSNSIKNRILNFLIEQTNDNPQVKKALTPVIPGLVQAYNSLNLDQYKILINKTLNDVLQLTNVLSADAANGVNFITEKFEGLNTTAISEYLSELLAAGNQNLTNQLLMQIDEYLPVLLNELKQTNGSIDELLSVFENAIISQLAVLFSDPSLVNSTTPFVDSLFDIYSRMQAMNKSILPEVLQTPEILAIITNFMKNLEQTKNIMVAFDSVKNDILLILYNGYMSDPNIPATFKSALFLKTSGDFLKTLIDTKNLTAAFEVAMHDLLIATVDYINEKMTTQLIPELVMAILENPDVPSFLKTSQVENLITKFLVSLYEDQNLYQAFDSIQNDTLMMLYNAFMSSPNVPTFLKNPQVQSVIIEFLTTYQQTKNLNEAFNSIKNETLQMLYNDLMADPQVPAIFKSPNFQAIIKDFTTAYSKTHNLTAALEASKESIISAAITLLLTDQSQLPSFFQTPEAQEVISKFLTAYMQSMDAQTAFDAIKLDLVNLLLNTTINDPSLPLILKAPDVQAILKEFFTTLVETMNISLSFESIQSEATKLLYDMFMANPDVPALLKNPSVQTLIIRFLNNFMENMDLSTALESVKNETYEFFYESFMNNPNVPEILKNSEVQTILAKFLINYKETKDIKTALESISSDLGSILYNQFMNNGNVPEIFKNQDLQNVVLDFAKHYEETKSIENAIKLTIEDLQPELQQAATDELKAFISGISPQLFELIQNASSVSEILDILGEYLKNELSQLGTSTTAPPMPTTQASAKKSSSLLEFSILESINEKDLSDKINSFKDNIGRKIALDLMRGIKILAKNFMPGLWKYIQYDDDIITFTNDFFKWLNGRVVARLLNLGFTEPPTTTTTTTSTSTTTTTKTTSTTTNAIDQQILDYINQLKNQSNFDNIFGPTNQPLQTLPIVIEWG